MEEYDLIVLGGGGAGVNAASEAIKYKGGISVLLITDEDHVAYPRCDLPYLMFGPLEKVEKILMDTVYDKQKGLTIIRRTRCTGIDIDAQRVITKSEAEKEVEYSYRSLIIATGSSSLTPPIDGIKARGVFSLRSLDDLELIREGLKETKSCVLIGAGAIGIEVGEILFKNGKEVTIVDVMPQVLPRVIDPDMAKIVEDVIVENGIKVIKGKCVNRIISEEGTVTGVEVEGETISADAVFVATGGRPNTDFMEGSGIKIGPTGGVETNNRMETNVKGIFAAGDCAETHNLMTKEPVVAFLGSTANKQGKVAGINAVGGNLYYEGTMLPFVLEVFDYEVGSVGLTQTDAKNRNYPCAVSKVSQYDRPLFTEEDKKSTVKMVADPDGKIIGCQIIGERVPSKIDQMAVGMYKGLTTKELMAYESAYAPIISQCLTTITLAAEVLQKKIDRMKKKK